MKRILSILMAVMPLCQLCAQVMIVHTKESVSRFPIADVDSITFSMEDDADDSSAERENERELMNGYIQENGITVIPESEFNAADCVTDCGKNEYVLLGESGIFTQIVSEGCGEKIKDGEACVALCRFREKIFRVALSLPIFRVPMPWCRKE